MQSPVHTETSGVAPRRRLAAFDLINVHLNQVRDLISRQLVAPKNAEGISALLEHIGSSGGKMLRPGLILLAGKCCGEITARHILVAATIEMIHTATLLHDDVMDDGRERRGMPTINSLWGNESAVLLGDFILGQVFKMCAELEPEVALVIANTAVRVCEGEMRQIAQRRNRQLSESEYIEIITEKSAALFSSSCHLGGLLADATEAQRRALLEFGLNAGIGFQIADDLLDITGDENTTGKTLGSDVDKNKLTLAVIHLLRTAKAGEKEAVKRELDNAGTDRNSLMEMLNSCGSLEYARAKAKEYAVRAAKALSSFEQSEAKNAMIETAQFMADRVI